MFLGSIGIRNCLHQPRSFLADPCKEAFSIQVGKAEQLFDHQKYYNVFGACWRTSDCTRRSNVVRISLCVCKMFYPLDTLSVFPFPLSFVMSPISLLVSFVLASTKFASLPISFRFRIPSLAALERDAFYRDIFKTVSQSPYG